MSEEKTEDPTQRRLQKAREKGQVLNITTGNKVVSLFMVMIALLIEAPVVFGDLQVLFERIGQDDTADAYTLLADTLIRLVRFIAIIFFATLGGAVLFSVIVKKGFIFSLDPVSLNFGRLNPASNLKNTYKLENIQSVLADVLKTVIWTGSCALLIYYYSPQIYMAFQAEVEDSYALATVLMAYMILMAVGFAVLFLIIDFIMESHSFTKSMKMTKQEVKQERRDQHGDPKIKSWRNEMSASLMRNTPQGAEHSTTLVKGKGGLLIGVRFDQKQLQVPFVVDIARDKASGKTTQRKALKAGAVLINDPALARLLASKSVGDMLMTPEEYRPIVMSSMNRNS